MKPKVIAISAVSGCGKTSAVNELVPNSKALYFDDFDFETPNNLYSMD
ncbi:MAG: hypothetical protein PWP51_516 [Clostridiales bacterium]|jgi:gluconate kinase|nr:hypothetical protein [Clostridiales bacterium]MDN5297963.1 hypothetical protein [Clostridiales bacterium]